MKLNIRHHKFFGPAAFATAAVLPLLTGCAGISTANPDPAITQALNMTGSIHGGQQPVSGAKIYLYSVGTYTNSPSTSMLNGTGYVTSDANGNFSITGDYTCPTGSTGISTYLLALGGNPGVGGTTSNSAIAMMAVLGPCSGLAASTFVNINEISTVAGVTALQQFMTDSTDIADGTVAAQPSYGMPQGIPNAMLTAASMVNVGTGLTTASPANSSGRVPQAKINTLGNILASCVNSSSSTSSQCAALFAAATPTGGPAPSDTIGAMLNIAKNPGANIAALYTLSSATSPFQPTLTTAPNDFTIGITYNAGLSYPGPIAIDNTGDVFIANCPSCNGAAGVDTIQGFMPSGAVLSTSAFTTNIHKPVAIAVDRYSSVWVAEAASGATGNQVTRIQNNPYTVAANFPVAFSGVPGGIAIVENGPSAAYVTDSTNGRMSLINNDATALGSVNTTGLANPTAIAADGLENLYLIGAGSNSLVQFSPIDPPGSSNPTTTGNFTTFAGAGAGFSSPAGLAVDGGAHVWTVDTGASKAVSEVFGLTGAANSPAAGYAGVNVASSISIDGAGTAWIANCRAGCAGSGSTAADNVVHLSATGASLTPSSDGLQNASFAQPSGTAIDISGNLWITNTAGASVTELVGVAVPVINELETASSRHALPAVNYLRNPNFELGTGSPAGWTVTSTANGSTNEDKGSPFSGQQKLTYYNGSAFTTTTSQTVSVPNGNYLVSCYIASGPGSTTRTTALQVSGYGGSLLQNAPSNLSYTFQPYSVVGVPVTTGTLTVGLYNMETYTGGGYTGWDSCSVTRQ